MNTDLGIPIAEYHLLAHCVIFTVLLLGLTVALGFALASIFIYDSLYLGKLIEREEAIAATGQFDSYGYSYSKGGAVSEVRISFRDREDLFIDGPCYHVELDGRLEGLRKGERLDMLLHPNSECIWELSDSEGVILSFDDARSRMKTDNIFFGVLFGGFSLLCAFMGIMGLLEKYRAYKKCKNL